MRGIALVKNGWPETQLDDHRHIQIYPVKQRGVQASHVTGGQRADDNVLMTTLGQRQA